RALLSIAKERRPMSLHVIFGAGAVGSSTAQELLKAGHQVRVVTRSGSGPDGVERVAADLADPDAARRVTAGAAAVYNCVNPKYTRWAKDWPPMATSLLAAARDADAVLVIMGNLYGYGPVDHPMVETDPLAATSVKGRVRAQMWHDALASGVRVTEARASDFVGPGLTSTSYLGDRFAPLILKGKTLRVFGDPDVAHSFTYMADVGRALATLGTDARAIGRPWHVPTNAPISLRQAASGMARAAGVATPKMVQIPHGLVRAVGAVWPLLREFEEVRYQHVR